MILFFSGAPSFWKLYGAFDQEVWKKGSKKAIFVANRYDATMWDGEKALIITTPSWIGAKSTWQSTVYLTVALLMLAVVVAVLLTHGVSTEHLDQIIYLDWIDYRQS